MNPFKSAMTFLNHLAQLLVLIGALNWGLIGATKVDAVAIIIPKSFIRHVHLAVGIAALFLIIQRFI